MMPILPSVISESGEIDRPSLNQLVKYCLDNQACAIGHLAWASEFNKLSRADRRVLTESLVEEVGGKVLIFIGVSGANRRIAAEFARDAQAQGADILMLAPPTGLAHKEKEIFDYYKAVSNETDLPMILQDVAIPGQYLSAEFICRAYNEIENIKYIKEEDHDFLSKIARMQELSKNQMPIIGGYGGKHMFQVLEMGIECFMTGTEALDIHNAVVRSYLEGKTKEAHDIYYNKLLPYFLFYQDNGEQLLKTMLYWRGIISNDFVITPNILRVMTEGELKVFRGVLEDIGYFDYKNQAGYKA